MKYAATLGAAAVALMLGAPTTQAQQTQPTDSAVVATAAPAADSAQQNTRRPRRNPRVLTAEDITRTGATNAFDVVSRVRSRWLHDRGPGEKDDAGPVLLQVYRNGQLVGGADALRQIAAGDIQTMEWVDPITARARYGPRAGHGVILVTDKP
ncbi:MAG TPA: hypothetical protein VGB15_17850 [Longimicrobium sp.]|jgi:hypothetical protein